MAACAAEGSSCGDGISAVVAILALRFEGVRDALKELGGFISDHRELLMKLAAAGGKPVYFNTITVTDGISMGTQGMRYSLVSRDVIADSIETAVAAEGFDGLVAIGGCDKNMPGCMIAIARLNRPAVFIYGGTILPGFTPGDCDHKKPLDIVSVFEAVGRHAKGELDAAGLKEVEKSAIPVSCWA